MNFRKMTEDESMMAQWEADLKDEDYPNSASWLDNPIIRKRLGLTPVDEDQDIDIAELCEDLGETSENIAKFISSMNDLAEHWKKGC
jgi:hypothetical protein